jgi:hypothetical protein
MYAWNKREKFSSRTCITIDLNPKPNLNPISKSSISIYLYLNKRHRVTVPRHRHLNRNLFYLNRNLFSSLSQFDFISVKETSQLSASLAVNYGQWNIIRHSLSAPEADFSQIVGARNVCLEERIKKMNSDL